MSTKKTVILVALIVCLVIYLAFANTIVASIYSDNPLQEVDFETLKTTQEGKYAVNWEFTDFYEILNVTGWAYCETDNPTDEKPVSIVLRGEKKSYLSKSPTQNTVEVGQVFGYMTDRTFRFEHSFSLVAIPDGIYDMYLYCEENEDDTMLVNLGKRFQKKNGNVEWTNTVLLDEAIEAETTEQVKCAVSQPEVRENVLTGAGWIFLEGEETLRQRVFLKVYSDEECKTYLIASGQRQDVMNYFEEEDYLYSGFIFELPAEEYAGKDISVEVIVELNGKYYTNGNIYEFPAE